MARIAICYMQSWVRRRIRLHDNLLDNIANHSVEGANAAPKAPSQWECEASRAKSISAWRRRGFGAVLLSGTGQFRTALRLIAYYSVQLEICSLSLQRMRDERAVINLISISRIEGGRKLRAGLLAAERRIRRLARNGRAQGRQPPDREGDENEAGSSRKGARPAHSGSG